MKRVKVFMSDHICPGRKGHWESAGADFLEKACVAAPPVTIMSMVGLPGVGEHTTGVSDALHFSSRSRNG